jgi:hypothetical protein
MAQRGDSEVRSLLGPKSAGTVDRKALGESVLQLVPTPALTEMFAADPERSKMTMKFESELGPSYSSSSIGVIYPDKLVVTKDKRVRFKSYICSR